MAFSEYLNFKFQLWDFAHLENLNCSCELLQYNCLSFYHPWLTFAIIFFNTFNNFKCFQYCAPYIVYFFEDIDWVQTEKHVFETASNHPFLVGLHSCFQTASRLFFVIEFVRGGDLMYVLITCFHEFSLLL